LVNNCLSKHAISKLEFRNIQQGLCTKAIYQQLAEKQCPEPNFCVQKYYTAARSFLPGKKTETAVLPISTKPFKKGPVSELYACQLFI